MIKIFEGENSFLSKKSLDIFVKKYREENKDTSIRIIDAENKNISEIWSEYETQDMFNPKKLLVVKRLLLNKGWKDFVEKILETKDLNSKTDIILWEDRNIAKNTRYFKKFNELKAIESFTKFNKRSFFTWAQKEAACLNLNEDLIQYLVEITNYEPNIFLNEIEKMRLSEKKSFSLKDLEQNTHDSYTSNIWEFLDSINEEGCREKRSKILNNLLDNKLDPHYLMIMIARNVKQLLLINNMLSEGKNDKEIVSILKIPPFTLPKLKSIAQKSEYGKLLNFYEKIYNLNYETKVGNIPPDLGLILLTTKLN